MAIKTNDLLKLANRITVVTSSLSSVGSILVLLTLSRIPKDKRSTVYHRLIMIISLYDLIVSIAYGSVTLPAPAETGLHWAHGTVATCSAQGFFRQWGSATFAYSAGLIIYYVLVVRYNVQEETITSLAAFQSRSKRMFSGRVPHAMRNRLKSGMYPRTRPANLPSSTVVSIDPRVCPICRDYCRPCDFELYRVEETPSHPEFGVLSSKSRTAPTEKLVERQEHQVHIQCLLYAASFTNSLLWGSIQNILRAIDTRQNTDLVAKNVWLFIPVASCRKFARGGARVDSMECPKIRRFCSVFRRDHIVAVTRGRCFPPTTTTKE
eukprot:scaffold29618_cov183-Amphora_coffeaeformis.AAC.4